MLAIKIDAATEKRLSEAARRLGEAPDALAERALRAYLEDVEDYARAVEAWQELDRGETTSLAEMKRELGLDN